MQKITPHLWFDKEAKEAAEFYVSVFDDDSKVSKAEIIPDTPSGDTEMVAFRLCGQDFLAISAGPMFKFNPSVSVIVNFDPSREEDARERIDKVCEKLSKDGTMLMPLDRYPFSERYGWVQDKYGLSWQLILTNPEGEERPTIVPSLMFAGENCGKAEEAIGFYLSVFRNSRQGNIVRYGAGQEFDKEGTVMFADYMLEDTWFAIMDSAYEHGFAFNEAFSFIVSCEAQEEIDYFWEKLSAVPDAEQCGWCKDKYGISWQIVPSVMEKLMRGTQEQRVRVTKALLGMKKLDIIALKNAYEKEL